ncbi:MAG: DNA polymerase III subunit beta [Acidobacteriota bacterium]
MDIRVDARALQSELNLALGIVESKATIPILSNLLLKAEGDHVELAATDLEVTLRTRCPAEVVSPGGITVPARKFGSIVRAFATSDAPLSLKTTAEGKLFLQPVGGRQEYHLQTLPEEDYPTLLDAGEAQQLKIPTSVFKRCISEVLVSVGMEDNRFSVRGGLLILEPDQLTMVSTDSHRLTYSQWNGPLAVEKPLRVLIPRKTLTEFLKLEDADGVTLAFRDNHIFLEMGRRFLYSRLMDTTFPAYEKVLPAESDKKAVLSRMALLERLKRVSMVAESKTRAVSVAFDPAGTLEVMVRNQETGDEGREYLTSETYEGEAIGIVFNVDYLIDFLTVSDAEKIVMAMKDPYYQVLFQPLRGEGESIHKYVVMPLRFD